MKPPPNIAFCALLLIKIRTCLLPIRSMNNINPAKHRGARKRRGSALTSSTETADESTKVVKEMRTDKKTVSGYANLLTHVVAYFKAERPELVQVGDGEELIMPLPSEAVIQYFGHLMQPATIRAKLKGPQELTEETEVAPYASTYIGSYRSAVVDLYRRSKHDFPTELNKELKEMTTGMLIILICVQLFFFNIIIVKFLLYFCTRV
jgi:hypothetical protein